MSMTELLTTIRAFDGVLALAPGEGSAFPRISWGDHFIYYAPDGEVPQREQPYATIVTKNYPGDTLSELDRPDRWRLNVHVGAAVFEDLLGEKPRSDTAGWDYATVDVVRPHPLYRARGWVSIVNPGDATRQLAADILRDAHEEAKRRARQRIVRLS